jgi:hypothetical protein
MKTRPSETDGVLTSDDVMPSGSTAPTIPEGRRRALESIDVEFSTAEAGVDPIPLTEKKTKPPGS